MPFSMAKKLNLGEITPTTLSLQMVDRSLTFPKGIIEDVLVKVDKFIFPVDFVVLDMEEDRAALIILGRPFAATGQSLIDVKNGEFVSNSAIGLLYGHDILTIYENLLL